MAAIYFDESGYTGRALLDPAQPHFIVASSMIDEAEAAALLAEAFPGFAGDEFKATDIWRRPRTRRRLPALAALLAERRDRIYLQHVDKRFCVLTKFVDHLIEPLAYETGHDFYRDSYAPRYCNWLHAGLTILGDAALYDAVIAPFYAFARDPNQERLHHLVRSLGLLATSGPRELREVFEMAKVGAETFHHRSDLETFRDVLEIQLTSVLTSVGWWHQRSAERFDLRHDASSNFFGQMEIWGQLTAQDMPEQLHDFAMGGILQFPLRVDSTLPLDSKDSRAIQLVDLIAGSAARLYPTPSTPEGAAERDELMDAGFGVLSVGGVAPGVEMIDGPPPIRTGPDLVDELAAIMGRREQ